MTRITKLLAAAGVLAWMTGPAHAQDRPVVIGAVVTQSGFLADLAADLRKALLLWQQDVNAAGGVLGRRVELRLADDRSEAGSVRALYEQLIRDEHADLLIGPFGSAATLGAAGAGEAHRRVLAAPPEPAPTPRAPLPPAASCSPPATPPWRARWRSAQKPMQARSACRS